MKHRFYICCILLFLGWQLSGSGQFLVSGCMPCFGAEREEADDALDMTDGKLFGLDMQSETEEMLSDLGLSELDDYLRQEDFGQISFSELVKDLISDGLLLDFSSIGKKLKEAVLQDYTDNRTVLIQILVIAVAFSILLPIPPARIPA